MILQTETLATPEHGLIAGVAVLVNFGVSMVHNYIRKKKRNGSLAHEVQSEVQRIFALRAAQDARAEMLNEHSVSDLKRQVRELDQGQVRIASQVTGVNTQLEAMRLGIFRLVATLKPELVADLELGGPIG